MATSATAPVKVYKFDVVQIRHEGKWLDYATVKDAADVQGINDNIRHSGKTFRIERYEDRSGHAITSDQEFVFAGKLHEWH